MRCYAYAFAFAFDVPSLRKYLQENFKFSVHDEAFCIKLTDNSVFNINVEEPAYIFIFTFGAIVTWGLSLENEQLLCKTLARFKGEKLGAEDDDEYEFDYVDLDAKSDTTQPDLEQSEKFTIIEDTITLANNSMFSKLACSHALAQSVKLGGFEATVQNAFKLSRKLPEELSQHGKISMPIKQIRKMMGRLFIDKISINLHLELLSAPNFFWNRTELEPIYQATIEYVDLENRVKVFNQRLEVVQSLLDMLSSELNNQYSSNLEWVIIILIFIEIVLVVVKEVFKWI